MYSSWDQYMTIEGTTIHLLNQKAKEDFIKDIEENGIYLIKPPHYNIRYDTVNEFTMNLNLFVQFNYTLICLELLEKR